MLIAILGRQPEIGMAELESLFGASAVLQISDRIASIDLQKIQSYTQALQRIGEGALPYHRFGSVIKFANVVGPTSYRDLAKSILGLVSSSQPAKEGAKLKIGISDYTEALSARKINEIGLTAKKELKRQGYSVRVVPNKTPALGSAQVIHNSLTKANGYEFIIFNDHGKLSFAKTVYEQDIEAYSARDQARPMRDARVGMLPPKLAQTIINLATGPISNWSLSENEKYQKILLDPFCGTGVVLQEALLIGMTAYGSDISERMVDYSGRNLTWLCEKKHLPIDKVLVEKADATNHKWKEPIDFVACETYLGEPLIVLPPRSAMERIISEVNNLHIKTLKNLSRQLASGTRLCLALPAWRTPRGFISLPALDQIEKFGYNQLVFSRVDAKNLIYARSDQIVARQLVVLQKI